MKTISDFPNYAATKDGKIWSKSRITRHKHRWRGHWLKPSSDTWGRLRVTLCDDNQKTKKLIHQIVLETYVGPCPIGMEACHNNGVRTDNRLENLRWDTRKANHADAIKHGTHRGLLNKGSENGNTHLKEKDVRMIIYMWKTRLFLQKELAEEYGVDKTTISYIVNKKSWKHLWEK